MTEDGSHLTVNVPLVWQVDAKFGREKQFRTLPQGTWEPVRIRRIGSVEAPVVASWFYMGGWSDDRQVTGREVVRVHDNAFYRPYRGHNNRLNSQQSAEEDLSRWVESRETNPLFSKLNANLKHSLGVAFKEMIHQTFVPANLDAAKQIGNSTRDAELAKLHELASEVLIVDGKLWEQCIEPVLLLTHHGLITNARNTGFFREPKVSVVFDHTATKQTEVFKLDDIDGVNAYLEFALTQKMGKSPSSTELPSVIFDFDNLEVDLPQALNATPEVSSLKALAAEMLSDLEENGLSRGRAFSNAWHDLKEAMQEPSEDADEICERVIRLSELQKATDCLQNCYYGEKAALIQQRVSTRPVQTFFHRNR